ncbi:recombinase family protein [uncultured Rhodoblastus sp.]|uniref:recombinase family protein n=1 Tax=uncultured Rhodoblastus sp. TaxID=543037 RepID=UPI0025CFC2D2|nr:recombinase family protein [uncultured Rhodoblastus sp.]
MAGYGLRRRLLDERGEPKGELRKGEQKSLQTDRVILVPGPADEVLTVRRMYRLFVEMSVKEREIAEKLNAEGTFTDLGRAWTRGSVHQVLTNEKYVGDNVFNRVSFKLKKTRVRNPPELVVKATGVFEPIVDRALFEAARRIIVERSRRYSDEDMLACLTNLLEQSGFLSALVIDEHDGLPSSSAYKSRFGSLLRAYKLVGYSPGRDYRYVETNRFLRSFHSGVVDKTIDTIRASGSTVIKHPETELLTINGEITASIVIARCIETATGAHRWKVRFDTSLQPDISVVLRMDHDNREVQDYYFLPRMNFFGQRVRMAEENGLHLDAFRFETIDPLFSLTSRVQIRRAS